MQAGISQAGTRLVSLRLSSPERYLNGISLFLTRDIVCQPLLRPKDTGDCWKVTWAIFSGVRHQKKEMTKGRGGKALKTRPSSAQGAGAGNRDQRFAQLLMRSKPHHPTTLHP